MDSRKSLRHRRQFLKFLAASPLVSVSAWAQETLKSPADALSVFDFEEVARRNVAIAHWGYMTSGVDDDLTVKANREGFQRIELRPRRLVDVSHTDSKTELFGTTFNSPIFICPCGGHRMFHPDGEVGTARAAKAKNTLQILSTMTSMPVEDVAQARGHGGLWYQLYAPQRWEDVETMLHRVEAAGCPVVALTVDQNAGRNSETFLRARRNDTRDCSACHEGAPGSLSKDRAMFKGIERRVNSRAMDWAFVDRLKKATSMKLLIKGLETREDARLAVEHGADGIIVSNHGGRAMEDYRATIESLPEVVDAVGGRIPVLVDSGFRRGSDVIKALALGAKAVGIGRPYLWGLGAFGQAGVEKVLDILQAELLLAMRQCGTPTLAQISRSTVALKSDFRF
jgi:4-hydroxymandelate oxidase